MRKYLETLLIVAASLAAWACLQKCQNPQSTKPPESPGYVVIDTIPYLLPVPKQEISLGAKTKFLPVFIPRDSNNAAQNIPLICNNDVQNIPDFSPDSAAVEIPITQREYEAEEDHAWVSGYEPSLDSIYVFPRHDVVTIREPPGRQKRWGVGVFAGYGMTPQGLQPCVGVSVNYNLFNF